MRAGSGCRRYRGSPQALAGWDLKHGDWVDACLAYHGLTGLVPIRGPSETPWNLLRIRGPEGHGLRR